MRNRVRRRRHSKIVACGTPPPLVESATISSDGSTLTVVFSEAVFGFEGTNCGFGLTASAVAYSDSWIDSYSSGDGTDTIVFSLSGGFPPINGKTLYLNYFDGLGEFTGTGIVQSADGAPLASFVGLLATNLAV